MFELRIYCPIQGVMGVCKQKINPDKDEFIVCGFYSESAGHCSIGLLADGLHAVNLQADRIANAAEALYSVLNDIEVGPVKGEDVK